MEEDFFADLLDVERIGDSDVEAFELPAAPVAALVATAPAQKKKGRSRDGRKYSCAIMRERRQWKMRHAQAVRVKQAAVLMNRGKSKKWSRSAASVAEKLEDLGRRKVAGRGKRGQARRRKRNSVNDDLADILTDGKRKTNQTLDDLAARDIAISRSKYLRCADIAREFEVKDYEVHIAQSLVQNSVLSRQLQLLKDWRDVAKGDPRFLAAHDMLGFDDAKFKLRLDLHVVSVERDVSSPWHVIVSFRQITLVFRMLSTVLLDIIMPVSVAQDTSAETLLQGLFVVGELEPLNTVIEELLSLSPHCSSAWAIDGAAGNQRLRGHKQSEHPERVVDETICLNHCNHKTEDVITNLFPEKAMQRLRATCSNIRMGSFLMRLTAQVLPVMIATINIVDGVPPVAEAVAVAQYLREWASYMKKQWLLFKKTHQASNNKREQT